jgi:hypothetical protein
MQAVAKGRSLAVCADDDMQLEWRVLKSLHGEVLPNYVLFHGMPFRDIENRERMKQWCRENGVEAASFRLTPKRSVYFQNEADAMLCVLAFA